MELYTAKCMRTFFYLLFWGIPLFFWAQASEPTIPVSNVNRGIENCDEVSVDWTPGNGSARIIVMRSGAPVSQLPQDGQTYTANSQYGLGSHLGNDNYVVYQGSGTAAQITGLQPTIDYHFAIFEFNGTGSNTNYLTSVYPSWNIPVPGPISISSILTDVSCFGYEDGAIAVTITGGNAPFTFLWNTGATTASLTGLSGGQYLVTVTDSVGCEQVGSYTIDEPTAVTYSLSGQNITCPGGADGSITSQVAGGSPPFSYVWNTGATSPNLSELESGIYSLTLTDANGCVFTTSIELTEPEPLAVAATTTPATCHDSEDAAISLSVSGANGGFQYAWSDGSNSAQVANLPAGTYTVTLTDQEDCSFTRSYTLSAPSPITANATIEEVSCEGNEDGSIDLNPAGGNGGFTFSWSTGSMNKSIRNLATGWYGVTLTDQEGCTLEEEFTIEITDDPRGCLKNLIIYEVFTPNGDGVNEFWVIEGLENYPENTLELFNRWGQPVFRADNYNSQWQGTTTNGKPLPHGTYYYLLTLHTTETIQLAGDVTFIR